MTARLYVVTRRDLPAGAQLAQSVHAARAFAEDYPAAERTWFAESNTLACLAAADEGELSELVERARMRGLLASEFREPDLGGALTAIALEPRGRALVRHLPLALS